MENMLYTSYKKVIYKYGDQVVVSRRLRFLASLASLHHLTSFTILSKLQASFHEEAMPSLFSLFDQKNLSNLDGD